MGTQTKQKARKEYVCSKCGKKILVGEEYIKYSASRFMKPRIVCCNSNCKPRRSELTTSDYLAWLYDLQDNVNITCYEDIENIKDDIENEKDELQDRLDNMPENLQYSPNGELLQERIDSLDDAYNDLDNIEDLDESELDEKRDEIIDELIEENDIDEDDEDFDRDAFIEEHEDEIENRLDEAKEEMWADKQSEVEDALSNIAE